RPESPTNAITSLVFLVTLSVNVPLTVALYLFLDALANDAWSKAGGVDKPVGGHE
ncbi:15456_t:CDS:1, partial [Funneliformis caledonium]